MAKYKQGKNAKYAESVVDEDNYASSVDLPIHSSPFSLDDSSFSAINTNFLPPTIDDPTECFDEFGFRKGSDAQKLTEKTIGIENTSHRMRFIAALEFTHSNLKGELVWSKVNVDALYTDKIEQLIKDGGIPHSMRPFLWPRFAGASRKQSAAGYSYEEVLRQSARDKPSIGVQIERSLLRIIPNNICFWRKSSAGTDALRRVLKAIAFIYPDLDFCEGMGVIAAILLLICSEETAFWMMTALIEDILPPNYYTHSLVGVQADERVVRYLMKSHVPDLNRILDDLDVEVSLVTVNWLITLFALVFPTRTLLRVWDFIFYAGSVSIFRVIISIMKMKEDELVDIGKSSKSAADLLSAISQLPHSVMEVDKLIEYMTSFEFTITEHLINELRKKYQAVVMADQGVIINIATDTNLPKQSIHRRKLMRSNNIIHQIFHLKEVKKENQLFDILLFFFLLTLLNNLCIQKDNDPKLKNVRQTEILVDLKHSILQICRYFISCDEQMELNISVRADYSSESHAQDIDNFLAGRREGYKRARALLDFARRDEDELGFRKNDIITVICEKDEHCWVGEVNGLRGWFPAKFVEVVDERGKNYTIYGDEAVSPEITEYIRGRLANSFRQVMEHGIMESVLYPSTAHHPWEFIEDIAYYSVEKHFNLVSSRLTLCSTFKLDQDGKILTPEELLFRSVQLINDTHNSVSAHPDVKLRSLLVLGVNEQCLHLWFDLFCSSEHHGAIRSKYYHPWAFIRTPVWRQIKCELRLLSQFSFNLDVNFEIEGVEKSKNKTIAGMMSSNKKKIMSSVMAGDLKQNSEKPLNKGVTDMLIKHHLFSWDL
ncbi:RUN domain protein [Dictyocaulus viviparus]|uniref:RUN and TBC1 domain-containing protein 3 n=1 Tax=Dictyocaulus viviparus TaxID=29172 RepID=A0A0D8XIU8_DICVI|nr:RUN domain protein [Dictyocaulus viviparus]